MKFVRILENKKASERETKCNAITPISQHTLADKTHQQVDLPKHMKHRRDAENITLRYVGDH
jgi:hypothetical protein